MTKPWLPFFYLSCFAVSFFFSSHPILTQISAALTSTKEYSKIATRQLQSESESSLADSLRYLNTLLINTNSFGTWEELTNGGSMGYVNQKGLAYMDYISEMTTMDEFGFNLFIFDGPYMDDAFTRITFKEHIPWLTHDHYSAQSNSLMLRNMTVYVARGAVLSDMTIEKCTADSQMSFVHKRTGEPFVPTNDLSKDKKTMGLKFFMQSPDCLINFNTTALAQEDSLSTPSLAYAFLMTGAALFQCMACQIILKLLDQGIINARRFSLGTLRIINAFDFYLCLVNLGRFKENSLIVSLTAIPFAILSLHFEFKLIVAVLKLQTNVTPTEQTRLNYSNGIWLFISMVAMIVSGVYGAPEFIYFTFALSELPQIIQNMILQQRHRWNCCQFIPFALPKLGYLFYRLTYTKNLFRRSPNPQLFIVLLSLIIIQLIVQIIQTRRPRLWMKEGASYKFYEATDKEFIGQDVCCICLEKLTNSLDETKEIPLLKASISTVNNRNQMVATPCNHSFHETCLRDWIKLKHECPYCRCGLPYMPGDNA